jgi:propanediol dehydratase large subunit
MLTQFTSRAARGAAPQGGGGSAAGSSVQSGYQDRHSFVSVVGREVELAAISAAVKASQEGALTCCILEGEAGMGKSTLVPLLRYVCSLWN